MSPEDRIGAWLSAALEDPMVCDEMKQDIKDWFDQTNDQSGMTLRDHFALKASEKDIEHWMPKGFTETVIQRDAFEYWNAVEGWVKIDEVREHFDAVGCGTIYKSAGEGRTPLYTTQPKREWVRLTDEEVFELADTNLYDGGKNFGVLAFARAIEAKLKEKNGG